MGFESLCCQYGMKSYIVNRELFHGEVGFAITEPSREALTKPHRMKPLKGEVK